MVAILAYDLHDREVRLDNGWLIKIGRGLDFYQKPLSWHQVKSERFVVTKVLGDKGGCISGSCIALETNLP